MNPLNHITESDLMLYQLQDPDLDTVAADEIHCHLEACPACAELATSIAQTLRVFSADPVPSPDLDRAWHLLRPQLFPLARAVSSPPFWLLRPVPLVGLGLVVLLFLAAFLRSHHAISSTASPIAESISSGPLTDHPVDPALAAHLDSAERFLTEVSHTSNPLNPATRTQAQALLVGNAFYVQSARQHGDLADAALLEKLGRVLTSVDHDASSDSTSGWHVRLELNTNGLLLDLRILRQNQAAALTTSPQITQGALQ